MLLTGKQRLKKVWGPPFHATVIRKSSFIGDVVSFPISLLSGSPPRPPLHPIYMFVDNCQGSSQTNFPHRPKK